MTNEDKYNLYNAEDLKSMTLFEQYKYLTENDEDIVKLKKQINCTF